MVEHRIIYLASPIDLSRSNNALTRLQETRLSVKSWLELYGVGWFDPSAAFGVVGLRTGPEISKINFAAQMRATGTIAILPAGVPTVGVPMEIQRAYAQLGQPVAVLTDYDGAWALEISAPHVQRFGTSDKEAKQAVEWLLIQKPAGRERRRQSIGAKLLTDAAELPVRAYDDDAGFDLFVSQYRMIPPGEFVDVPCGVALDLPEHCWAMLVGRSSTLRRRGLLVNQGTIDPGYRGELFAGVWNLTDHPIEVGVGERIAQVILMSNQTQIHELVEVEQLSDHPRGQAGFGSTGA